MKEDLNLMKEDSMMMKCLHYLAMVEEEAKEVEEEEVIEAEVNSEVEVVMIEVVVVISGVEVEVTITDKMTKKEVVEAEA